MADYVRSIHRTVTAGSGFIIARPTTVSAFSVNAVDADTIVNLRDGGAAGAIVWTLEADNGASSAAITFAPPLRFYHNVYLEFVVSGVQSSADIAVVEP
jgi:hypothetical protein